MRAGRARCFCAPAGRAGRSAQLQALCDDLAMIVSLAMQHGVPAATLARAAGREGDGAPASLAGAALDLLEDAP